MMKTQLPVKPAPTCLQAALDPAHRARSGVAPMVHVRDQRESQRGQITAEQWRLVEQVEAFVSTVVTMEL